MSLIGLSVTVQFVAQLLHTAVQGINSGGKMFWLTRAAYRLQLLATLNHCFSLNKPPPPL